MIDRIFAVQAIWSSEYDMARLLL